MGLFEKKYCDFCGEKIGLLGNRKLEDGNMCKNCAAKLSPWFSDRRRSTKSDIQAQLDYREQNKGRVASFNATKTIGKHTKLMIDEGAKTFMVTSARDLTSANPDVLDFSQLIGCNLEINEDRNELKQKDASGNYVSYTPPRYEYSYDFGVKIQVNNPYFNEMSFDISDGSVSTGEKKMNMNEVPSAGGGWTVHSSDSSSDLGEYYECISIGNEIKASVEQMKAQAQGGSQPLPQEQAAPQPKPAVTCPSCGATTVPDANGCCEYCGAKL
ncbi:MAG: DUF4428 domain-containing protein [Treponema sp.]|nr:DUF4428 domain-containing protein [Treponema sp.]MBR4386153.1 DUF4428 domain-containing protein [Treponema sp.]